MVTRHSINLKQVYEPCFATTRYGGCKVLAIMHEECGCYKCPFYKPKDCKDWVRIKDRTGINLIPPEDLM